jgi:hypothetical protein
MSALESVARERMKTHAVPGAQLGLIDGDDKATSALGIADIRAGKPTDDETISCPFLSAR